MDQDDAIFTKPNVRKLIQQREAHNEATHKTVSFNLHTVDVSIGGTETPGRIKGCDSILDMGGSPVLVDSHHRKHTRSGEQPRIAILAKKFKPEDPRHGTDRENDKNTPDRSKVTPLREKHLSQVNWKKPHPGTTPVRSNGTKIPRPSSPLTHGEMHTPVQLRRHTLEHMNMNTPECFSTVTFETPVSARKQRKSDSSASNEDCGVTVAVRVRPFNQRELNEEAINVVSMQHQETVVGTDAGPLHRFTYDHSFWSFDQLGGDYADQDHVYNMLGQPLLAKAFEGYNTCLFAYGQTGSGKSYSIMGHGKERGIIPRFCEELFARPVTPDLRAMKVEISFFEIYNEKVHDLLAPSNKDKMAKKATLKVREHQVLGPYVEGLTCYMVNSFEDVKVWLNLGNKQRATASTGMNDKSSRSHSVFTMVLTQTKDRWSLNENAHQVMMVDGDEHEHSITSKINIVDLAGSERQSLAKTSGDRLKEGACINKSLMTLGKVISLLAESGNKKKTSYIPYRDSVLTWLLKESLGGNSKTTMLATISPSSVHVEETLSTLRYAKEARFIINKAHVNEDPNTRLIADLRAEIDKLRGMTGVGYNEEMRLAEINSLKNKLKDQEREIKEVTRKWQEKLKQSEARKVEEDRLLKASGVSFTTNNKMTCKMPCLVNLNEDPQLSEMLLYFIKPGETKVGRQRLNSDRDVQLSGALIADNHCALTNEGDVVRLEPVAEAQTFVNGNLICESTVLHHGDRVILGGNHYFRFNHPSEVKTGRMSSSTDTIGAGPLKDFEFARQELVAVQEEKLREVEESKRKQELELKQQLQQLQQKEEEHREMLRQVELSKEEAQMELGIQRRQYEERLRLLTEELKQNQEGRLESQDAISKLEQQKMILERQIQANKRQQELEAEATPMEVPSARHDQARVLKKLGDVMEQMTKDVKRMHERKSSQRGQPEVMIKLREANNISKFLKKDVVFRQEEVLNNDKPETIIKVTNSKLGVSTFWTLEKFGERLIQMRELYKLYNSGDESTSEECDEVFFDPNDNWEKEEKIESSPNLSPKLVKGLGFFGSPLKRVSYDAGSSCVNTTSSRSLRSGCSTSGGASTKPPSIAEEQEDTDENGAISLFRDAMSAALDRYQGPTLQHTQADRVLINCDMIKHSITSLLDAFNECQCDNKNKHKAFTKNLENKRHGLKLMTSMELVLSYCASWTAFLETTPGALTDLGTSMNNTAKKLGSQLLLFLQGCENNIDSMVQESASKALDSLFMLCRLSGELALATDTNVLSLREPFNDIDDPTVHRLGHDVRQAFITGCDTSVDRTVQAGLKTVEEAETQSQILRDDCQPSNQMPTEDLLANLEMTTSSVKVLLEKCQQLQVELDTSLMESLDKKPEHHYYCHYKRAQCVSTHVSNLAEHLSAMVKGAAPLTKGNPGGLQQLSSSALLVQKSSLKLVAAAGSDQFNSSTSDSQLELSETSLLSQTQTEQLEFCIQEVRYATDLLSNMALKHATAMQS